MVEEVHVHSLTARNLREHELPSPRELENFTKLIRTLLKHRTKPLGVIYEVIAVNTKKLIQSLSLLLDMIEKT